RASRTPREWKRVHADAVANATRTRAPVPEGDRDRLRRLTGLHVHRKFEAAAGVVEDDDVACLESETRRIRRRDRRVIAPRHLRDRVGQFLKPGIVGVRAVAYGDRLVEMQFVGVGSPTGGGVRLR